VCKAKELEVIAEVEGEQAAEDQQGCTACAATTCSASCPGVNCAACLEARCENCLGDLVEVNDEMAAAAAEEETILSPKCEKCIVQRCGSSCQLGQDCTKCVIKKCGECSDFEVAAVAKEIDASDESEEPIVAAGALAASSPLQDAKRCNECSLIKCKASCTKDSCPACAKKKCKACIPPLTQSERLIARKQRKRRKRN